MKKAVRWGCFNMTRGNRTNRSFRLDAEDYDYLESMAAIHKTTPNAFLRFLLKQQRGIQMPVSEMRNTEGDGDD